jgi:hypothetical protein
MASYTLDDIRAAAEAKYGATEIETSNGPCRLINALRLPKKKREELTAIQERIDNGEDHADVLEHALKLVAENPTQARNLLKDIDGDLAVLVEVFNAYTEGTQAGEASASDN